MMRHIVLLITLHVRVVVIASPLLLVPWENGWFMYHFLGTNTTSIGHFQASTVVGKKSNSHERCSMMRRCSHRTYFRIYINLEVCVENGGDFTTMHPSHLHVEVDLLKANRRHKFIVLCLSLLSLHVEVHMEGEMRRCLSVPCSVANCNRTKVLLKGFFTSL
jgi:hypothetical protein